MVNELILIESVGSGGAGGGLMRELVGVLKAIRHGRKLNVFDSNHEM